MLREKRPIRSYHGEKFHTNQTNKKYLVKDFGHRCAYCNDLDAYGGGYRAYHVEHFAPKEKFPALRFDYDNLLYACPWCNRAKWDIWPSDDPQKNIVGEEGFVDPCTEEYDKHLKRLPNGSIAAITPLGRYMYETLKLYLTRHAIVHNVDRLTRKIDELKDSIAADKLIGKECSKKEAALQLIMMDFFEYFKMWKEISEEIT